MQLPTTSTLMTWPAINHVNPETRGPGFSIINCALLPITLFALGLRIYARIRINRCWRIDDTMIISSLIPTMALSILGLVWDAQTGWKHIWDYFATDLISGLRLSLVSQILHMTAVILIKVSILMLIRRLLLESQVLVRKVIDIFAIAVATIGLLLMFLTLLQCNKISDYWSLSPRPQQCISEWKLLLTAGIASLATSPLLFTLFLLPHYRTITAVLFLTSLIVMIAGSARTYYQLYAVHSPDRIWDLYHVWIAGTIEIYTGMIIIALAPIRYLISPTPDDLSSPGSTDSKKYNTYKSGYYNKEKHPKNPIHSFRFSFTEAVTRRSEVPPLVINNDFSLYLQGHVEGSHKLSPIAEESSKCSKLGLSLRHWSYRSSISSFNVVPHTSSLKHPLPATFYNDQTSDVTISPRTPPDSMVKNDDVLQVPSRDALAKCDPTLQNKYYQETRGQGVAPAKGIDRSPLGNDAYKLSTFEFESSLERNQSVASSSSWITWNSSRGLP